MALKWSPRWHAMELDAEKAKKREKRTIQEREPGKSEAG
jgi:hypothetical protein